jgi:putative ABC transport system permease protein
MSLAYTMVRHRFAGFAGTFVAVALGVALVCGAATLYLSSRPQTPARYAASAVLVHSPTVGTNDDGSPEYRSWTADSARYLTARLAALPGVSAAAADPAFYVQRLAGGRATGDPDASLIDGHAWSSAALGGYRLTAGESPSRDGQVALAGFAPGASVEVLTAAGPATWTVTGTVDGPGFYVADAAALRMSAGVRIIGLTVTGDPATVAAAARQVVGADGTVLSGGARDSLEPDSVTRIRWLGAQLLIALVGLGCFAAVFVVAATCALSAAQRRREIGLLRAVGATPGQVRRLMYAETLVVAALAGLAGVPLGALTAPLLTGPLIDAGLEPAGFTVTAQPLVWAGAFALGVVVALAGVWSAARRSSRVPALDALREAAVDRRAMTAARWVFGLLGVAGGVTLLAALPSLPVNSQSTAGLLAAMLLLTAAALLAPVLIVPLVRTVTWPWRGAATGMLVREGTLTGVRRVASTAGPVLLAVGFTVLLAGTVATIGNVEGPSEAAKIPAATVAAPLDTPGLSDAAVAAQPGTSNLPTRVLVTRGASTKGYDAAGVSDASGLILSSAAASELHRSTGDAVSLTFADGSRAELPVTAVYQEPPAPIVLPRAVVRAHDPAALTSSVLLGGPAVPASGMRAMTARAYVQEDIDAEGRLINLFLWVLIGLVVGYSGLAVANTLLMATAARRPEFRALRLAGAGQSQVLRVTTAEALLAVLVGTVLGGAVAAVSLTGVQHAVEAELKLHVPIVIPWTASVAVTAACALVAVLATAVPVIRRT